MGRGRGRRSGKLKMNKEGLALCREDQRNRQTRCRMEDAFLKKFVFATYEEIHMPVFVHLHDRVGLGKCARVS